MKNFLTDKRVSEKVSFVINGLTINGLVPTYAYGDGGKLYCFHLARGKRDKKVKNT